jgi:hypothetical protein
MAKLYREKCKIFTFFEPKYIYIYNMEKYNNLSPKF